MGELVIAGKLMSQGRFLCSLFVGSLISFPATAQVAVPISGVYGSDVTCRLYSTAGAAGITSGGEIGNPDGVDVDIDASDYLLVTPRQVLSVELECSPVAVESQAVTLECGDEVPRYTATIAESADKLSLTYSDDTGTVVLGRCSP